MQLFYTTDIKGHYAYLPEEEARHCVQVLRKREGDKLHFVDGKGTLYMGEIAETGKKTCVISIQKEESPYNIRSFQLHIAIAPTKSIDRFQWFLEKATEIGVDTITPLLCQNSERKRIREDRLQKVMISAMKQSLRAQLPLLNPLTTFNTFFDQLETDKHDQKLIAHCREGLAPIREKYTPNADVILMIGPEGDFTQEEIAYAKMNGFEAISLGPSRLRTETAGIVGCQILNFLSES